MSAGPRKTSTEFRAQITQKTAEKRKMSARLRKTSTKFGLRFGKVHYSQNCVIHLIDLIYMHYQN
jgi:hypothetical protein